MPEKILTTDPPEIDENDFDEFLATDDLFVDYFNTFLELPSFPEPLRFNTDTGGFEVLTPEKFKLADKIKSYARSQTPISQVYKNAIPHPPIRLPHYEREKAEENNEEEEEIKTSFSVKCLDKEQGMQWIKRFRLPTFLRSDLYMEYRLAKLLSQIETRRCGIKLTVDQTYRPWHKEKKVTPPTTPVDEKGQMMERLSVTMGYSTPSQTQQWFTMAKQSRKTRFKYHSPVPTPRRKSSSRPISSMDSRRDIADDAEEYFKKENNEIEPELSDDESDQGVGSESDESKEETNSEKSVEQEQKNKLGEDSSLAQHFIFFSYQGKMSFIPLFNQQPKIFYPNYFLGSYNFDVTGVTSYSSVFVSLAIKEAFLSMSPNLSSTKLDNIVNLDPIIKSSSQDGGIPLSQLTHNTSFLTGMYDINKTKCFNKFKTFLQNTIGEKLLLLWLDIDKSRFAVHQDKTTTYLQKLRKTYLKIGSTKRLPKECLSRYKLEHATLWRIDHLHDVQRNIAESLLLYWAPRYLVRQTPKIPSNIFGVDNPEEQGKKSHDPRPLSSQSYPSPKTMTIAPLRPKSCFPRLKERGRKGFQLPVRRPASAGKGDFIKTKTLGPLTRQTRARFEKKNSAAPKLNKSVSFKIFFSFFFYGISFVEKIRVKSSVMIRSPPSSVTSQVTVKGSPAMESMLQALYHDTRAGWFFTQFCEQSGNKMWNNAVHFWFDLQDFHHLFYGEIFDHFTVERKAQLIFSTYIVSGARENIGVSVATRRQIQLKLSPAFDELFDSAEEQVLKMLIVPWNQMLGTDQASYSKIELIKQERNLNVAPRYLTYLQKKGIKQKKQPVKTEQESMEKYEEDLWMKVPEDVKNYTFDELIRNRIELEFFRKFLEENYAKTDLLCWLDIESFKRIPHPANEKRDEKAKEIRTKYLHKKYFFGPNSPATKDEQNKAVLAGGGWGKTLKERPPNELITEAQKYVRQRIEKRWLPLFLATEEFQDRQRPKSQMSDVADDVILQKKKKRGEPWRLLDNRWQSSSRDLMEFRRGLTNRITTSQFRKYVSLKGEFLENDVLFWVEVQKYKDFCHIHNDPVSTEIKVTSIINCFISSHIPPSLQIDISAEMAEKIIEKRKEMGPYVFREAQLTVFRVLFTHWSGFCEFRKNLSDEKITSTLERQRRKRMERIKKQIKEQEEEENKEEAKAAKEADTLDLPDILSTRGSEIAESVMSESRHNNLAWSYGKHVEGLERQRQLLIMENEVK
uniref:RGS domain-containing protein n=1 Tax=Ciona intestinalis TaxID=7719 RepID=F6X153_CIOIN